MLITSPYNGMNFNIDIIKKRVLLNGKELNKKKIYWANHCREIFLSQDYVVKAVLDSNDTSSFNQNILEFRKWKRISKNKADSIYFAPVVYCDKMGLFLVQKRFYFTSHRRTEEIRDKIKYLCSKYDVGDVPNYENRNWAMIGKNHPLIYDYGSDEYWSE